jgi:23S rRNA pseudouridine1911/1915/1917 synthase
LVAIEPLLLRQGLQKLRRQALHAGALGFVHPVTGEKLIFSSPLPTDIEEAIALLKKLDGAGDFFSQKEEWRGQKSEGIDPF